MNFPWWAYVALFVYAFVAVLIARALERDWQVEDGPAFLIAVVSLLWGPIAVVAVPMGVGTWWKKRRARTEAARELRDAVLDKLYPLDRMAVEEQCDHGRPWYACPTCEDDDNE